MSDEGFGLFEKVEYVPPAVEAEADEPVEDETEDE